MKYLFEEIKATSILALRYQPSKERTTKDLAFRNSGAVFDEIKRKEKDVSKE